MILGTHINLSGANKKNGNSLSNSLIIAKDFLGSNALQIFTKSPIRYGSVKINAVDREEAKKYLKYNEIFLVIHGQYILNFCKKTEKVLWAIDSVVEDLIFLDILLEDNDSHLPSGVIIHMGKDTENLGKEICMKNFAYAISSVFNKISTNNHKVNLILETSVKSKNDMFYTIQDLSKLYNSLQENIRKRVKFCVDTCHIFASGYNISQVDQMKKYFDDFDSEIGINNIIVIHLNDSKNKVNSGLDRHENIGDGHIFGENLDSLRYLLQLAEKNKIPVITETPTKSPKKELDFLRFI
ncbi:MAG TPA: deoxyribonuclease IV [Allocoleopsis sp.]